MDFKRIITESSKQFAFQMKTFHPIPHFISDFQSLWYHYLSYLNFIVINNHKLYSLYNIQNVHTYNLANKFFRHVPFPYFNSLHKLLYFSDSAPPLPLPRLTVKRDFGVLWGEAIYHTISICMKKYFHRYNREVVFRIKIKPI